MIGLNLSFVQYRTAGAAAVGLDFSATGNSQYITILFTGF